MNIKVKAINPPKKSNHYLYISNHLGMLDILVLASVRESLFITSMDMRETPVLGLLTDMGGCLYVERRNRSNIHNEVLEIREALNQGTSVTLYPEGVAHNGEKVLPFKKTLMTAAAGTGVPLMPLVLNFRRVNGQPMSVRWREHVFWWGNQSFISTLFKILSLDSVEVDIEFFEEVLVHNEEERRTVAAQIHQIIESKFKPIV